MKVIITTKVDPASMNIREKLIENFKFKESEDTFDGSSVHALKDILLLTTNRELVYYDYLDREIKKQLGVTPEIIVFASRHSSQQKLPTLTTHTPGNWGKATYGGKDRSLAIAEPNAMKLALLKLNGLNDLGWKVCYEVTHHGPSEIEVPSLFIEIGSSKEEWKNERAGEIVAETILYLLNYYQKVNFTVAIGVGGGHYAPDQTKAALNSDLAFSHIVPKYVDPLPKEMLLKAIKRTSTKVDAIYIDWKGTKGKTKQMAKSLAKELGLDVIKG